MGGFGQSSFHLSSPKPNKTRDLGDIYRPGEISAGEMPDGSIVLILAAILAGNVSTARDGNAWPWRMAAAPAS